MDRLIEIESADRRLLAGIAADNAEAARRSGEWLVCKPGCSSCCLGPFAITALDALRLRRGMEWLASADPGRAGQVRARAAAYLAALANLYPGDADTGELWDEDALPDSLDDVACPALDPATGCCDLYEWRPVTCRTFGPAAVIADQAFGACELCYAGATDDAIAACAVEFDSEGLEARLVTSLGEAGFPGPTIVAYALRLPAGPRGTL